MNKTYKIKNSLIIGLINFLGLEELQGNKSRQRTRFIKLLKDRAEEIQKTKKEIIEKFAKKDKDGIILETKQENGLVSYEFEEGKIDEANKELEEYLNEELVTDILEEHKEKLAVVKDIILNTEVKFKGIDAVMYDEWCDAFELV